MQSLLDGLKYATSMEEKAAIFKLVKTYAEKEANHAQSNHKEKEKVIPPPPLPMTSLWKQFQKPVNVQKASKFNSEYVTKNEYNLICTEIKEVKKEIQNLYLMYYELQKDNDLTGMPPLERDEEWEQDEDWKQEAKQQRTEEQRFSNMTIDFHDIAKTSEEAMTYVIRIPVQFTIKNYQGKSLLMKALVDTGSRLNVIHPSLVPIEFREKCKSLDAISTSNATTLVDYQVSAKVYLSPTVWIEIILILLKNHNGIILGTPFLSQVFPHKYVEIKPATSTRPPQYAVKFTIQKEKFIFPFISKSSPNILG